jgi:hypothetical protein
MNEMKRNIPHFELARIYQDGSQETERIELCNLENVLNKGSNLTMPRRGFLGLAALSTGALVVACSASTAAPTPTPPPTDTPTPTPTPPPTDTPTPTPTPPPTGQANGELDVRVGPGDEYDVSFTLSDGTQFTLSARDSTSSWVEISTSDEQTGWVPVSQITIDPSVSIDSLQVSSDYPPPPQPTEAPTVEPTTIPGGGGGGSCDPNQDPNCLCTCNEICTCIPVG